jgi:hypothetical protein
MLSPRCCVRHVKKPVPIGRERGRGRIGREDFMASEQAANIEVAESTEERLRRARPVDLVYLSRYTLGERALEREVLELFCSQAVLYLEQLRAAMSDKAWKGAAHSLKRSAPCGRGVARGSGRRARRRPARRRTDPVPRRADQRDRSLAARGGGFYRLRAQGLLTAGPRDKAPQGAGVSGSIAL